MRKNWKKILSLLLSASMVLSMGVMVSAAEVKEVASDGLKVDGVDLGLLDVSPVSPTDQSPTDASGFDAYETAIPANDSASANEALKKNYEIMVAQRVSENKTVSMDGTTYKFIISMNEVIAYDGRAHAVAGNKKVNKPGKVTDVRVSLIVSENKAGGKFWVVPETALKVAVKNPKLATVSLNGAGAKDAKGNVVLNKKVAYIKSIKIDKKTTVFGSALDKKGIGAVNKDLATVLKAAVRSLTKDNGKSPYKGDIEAVKADGKMINGTAVEEKDINLYKIVIPVYPVYAGTAYELPKMFKATPTAGTMKKAGKYKGQMVTIAWDGAGKSKNFKLKYNAKKLKDFEIATPADVKLGGTNLIMRGNYCGVLNVK